MKALYFNKYGQVSGIRVKEVETPKVKEKQVLVKVMAASINDWDLGIIRGKPWINRLLFGLLKPKIKVVGSDIAGLIEAIGPGVDQFKVGDRVYGDLSNDGFGGFAEYVVAGQNHLRPMTKTMTFKQAACLPQAGVLAYQGLNDFTDIRPGMAICVNGAGGGVGTYLGQLLKDQGVHLTGVDAEVKRDLCLNLGYDDFIDYQKEDFTQGSREYDLIIDCKTLRRPKAYSSCLKKDGYYISLGGHMSKIIGMMLFSKHLYKKYGQYFKVVQLKTNGYLEELNDLYDRGDLISVEDPNTFGLDQAKEAMIYYASGQQLGKVLIDLERKGGEDHG